MSKLTPPAYDDVFADLHDAPGSLAIVGVIGGAFSGGLVGFVLGLFAAGWL